MEDEEEADVANLVDPMADLTEAWSEEAEDGEISVADYEAENDQALRQLDGMVEDEDNLADYILSNSIHEGPSEGEIPGELAKDSEVGIDDSAMIDDPIIDDSLIQGAESIEGGGDQEKGFPYGVTSVSKVAGNPVISEATFEPKFQDYEDDKESVGDYDIAMASDEFLDGIIAEPEFESEPELALELADLNLDEDEIDTAVAAVDIHRSELEAIIQLAVIEIQKVTQNAKPTRVQLAMAVPDKPYYLKKGLQGTPALPRGYTDIADDDFEDMSEGEVLAALSEGIAEPDMEPESAVIQLPIAPKIDPETPKKPAARQLIAHNAVRSTVVASYDLTKVRGHSGATRTATTNASPGATQRGKTVKPQRVEFTEQVTNVGKVCIDPIVDPIVLPGETPLHGTLIATAQVQTKEDLVALMAVRRFEAGQRNPMEKKHKPRIPLSHLDQVLIGRRIEIHHG